MNIEDEQWVEHALIDYERKRCISKILSISCQDAIPKGNNYSSDLLRLNMKVVLHSGDVVNRSFIYKAMPKTEARRKMIKAANMFRKEAMMLTEIWPEMERIRKEYEAGVESISPKCYGFTKGCEGVLMEDLTESGFRMVDRTKLLDMDHAKLVMSAHAEFHALSLILIERGDLMLSEFSLDYMYDHPNLLQYPIISGLSHLASVIEEKWEPEWHIYSEKVRAFTKTAPAQFLEGQKFDESNVNVLTLGDCWLTNMMFRYDSDGSPKNIRLLDFQVNHYNNVGKDLQFFLNTSLNAEAQARKEELVRFHYDKFKHSLEVYGYSGEIPSFERVLESYKRANAYGLVMGLAFIPFVIQPQESVAQDLEEWAKDFSNEKGMACPDLDTEQYRSIMKVLLKEGCSAGIL